VENIFPCELPMLADMNLTVNGKCVPFAHFRKGTGVLRGRTIKPTS
jgi:hypothetical protein